MSFRVMTEEALTEAELAEWGERFAAELAPGAHWVGLRGELGAGKSVLARAIARGLGVRAEMPSPTYMLLLQYEGRGRSVAHLDLYRVRSPSELLELGWEELGADDEVVLVEWPERAEDLWPEDAIELTLRPAEGASQRRTLTVERGPPTHPRLR